jgi:hypothetical protein
MSEDARTILIDDYRIGKIENIARDNKTIFSNWQDFVNETIGMYLNWWTQPLRSFAQFNELIPHMTDEMLEKIKTIMDDNEFDNITKNLEERRN